MFSQLARLPKPKRPANAISPDSPTLPPISHSTKKISVSQIVPAPITRVPGPSVQITINPALMKPKEEAQTSAPIIHRQDGMLQLFHYEYPKPERIEVFDQNGEWSSLSVTLYNEKFKTKMIHGIVCDEKLENIIPAIQAQASEFEHRKEDEEAFKRFIAKPIQYFCVSYVSEMCGHGLISNQTIPPHTIIGTYSAAFNINRAGDSSSIHELERRYDMGFHFKDNNKKSLAVKLEDQSHHRYFDARFRANIYSDLTRFALHAPCASRINFLVNKNFLSAEFAKFVLTANTTYDQMVVQNTPIRYYKTLENTIDPFELIRIDYGVGYWIEARAPQAQVSEYHSSPTYEGMPCLFKYTWKNNELDILNFDTKQNKYVLSNEKVILPRNGMTFFSSSSSSVSSSTSISAKSNSNSSANQLPYITTTFGK